MGDRKRTGFLDGMKIERIDSEVRTEVVDIGKGDPCLEEWVRFGEKVHGIHFLFYVNLPQPQN
jgi:hypothetical protein